MRRKILCGLSFFLLSVGLCACGGQTEESSAPQTIQQEESSVSQPESTDASSDAEEESVDWTAYFQKMSKVKSFKGLEDTNPIMTQRFGADPYAMVYGDRVYFYMTADAFEYDAANNIKENSYGQIRSLNVVSTDDMVNFTDHGSIQVAGKGGCQVGRQFLGSCGSLEGDRRKTEILPVFCQLRRRDRRFDRRFADRPLHRPHRSRAGIQKYSKLCGCSLAV